MGFCAGALIGKLPVHVRIKVERMGQGGRHGSSKAPARRLGRWVTRTFGLGRVELASVFGILAYTKTPYVAGHRFGLFGREAFVKRNRLAVAQDRSDFISPLACFVSPGTNLRPAGLGLWFRYFCHSFAANRSFARNRKPR